MNMPPEGHGRITDVNDARTKSLLRGLLSRDVDTRTWATYDNLRTTTSPADIDKVSRLLLCSPLFAHLPIVDDFPAEPPTMIHPKRATTQPLHNEIVFQGIRIEKNTDRLLSALADLQQINVDLMADEVDRALDSINRFITKFGYSLLMLSKLAYVRATYSDRDTVTAFCSSELDKYGARRRNVIALGLMDMMGETYTYLRLRKNILEFANSKNTTEFARDIVNWQFRPIRLLREDMASQLQSHGLASVLDALVFLCIHQFNVEIFAQMRLDALIDQYIGPPLKDAWLKLSAEKCPSQLIKIDSEEPEFTDLTFYRRSLAWIEYKSISAFRNAADQLYSDNYVSGSVTNEPARRFLNVYFSDISTLNALARAPSAISVNVERYDNDQAGLFLRTLAFIYVLRSGVSRAADISSDQLLCLMNWTANVPSIATASELKTFFGEPCSDLMTTYLGTALIADASQLNIDEHGFRSGPCNSWCRCGLTMILLNLPTS
jgi:hypothetical protein